MLQTVVGEVEKCGLPLFVWKMVVLFLLHGLFWPLYAKTPPLDLTVGACGWLKILKVQSFGIGVVEGGFPVWRLCC